MLKLRVFVAVTLLVGSASGLCQAQYPQVTLSEGVTATAQASVPMRPEMLRLTMWVKAQGTDAKSAIAALTGHKQRVEKELAKMRAVADGIRFSATRVSKGTGGEEGQAAMMRRQMMMSGGEKMPTPPVVYTAQAAVVAQWKLAGITGDALALLPTTLKEQIAARDIAGDKNKPKLNDEAAEQLQEMMQMAQEEYGYYESNQQDKGPRIQFVAVIDAGKRKQATQQAFQSAKADAELLAEAAGHSIGALQNLSRIMDASSMRAQMYGMGYGGNVQYPSSVEPAPGTHVSAATLDEMMDTVTVTVSYSLK